MQRHAPEEWTDSDDIREAAEARYQRQQLDFRVEAWLRREGWKHTSDTPGCFWMWQRALPDGRVVLVDRAMAISLTEHWPEVLPTDAGTGAVTSGEAEKDGPSYCHPRCGRGANSAWQGVDGDGWCSPACEAQGAPVNPVSRAAAESTAAAQADAIKAAVAEANNRAADAFHQRENIHGSDFDVMDAEEFEAWLRSGADAPGAGKS